MKPCDLAARCCFYQKFKDRQSIVWKDLLKGYCEGEQHHKCERMRLFISSGVCPAENVTPIGLMPEAFLRIT